MKKSILFLAALLLLAGCGKMIEEDRKSQREFENQAILNSLRTVDYKGHSYIIYREVLGTKNFGGITHDPDCGCEEIEYYGCEVVKFFDCEENETVQ